MYVKNPDGRWIPFSGTITVLPQTYTEYEQLVNADDLVTIITYLDSNKDTVDNIEYVSAGIGKTITETFASGTSTLTITRSE